MERRFNDLRSGFLITVFSFITYFLIIPAQIKTKSNVEMGPEFFPKFMVLIIGLCGIILIIQNAYSLYKEGKLKLDILKNKEYKVDLKPYKSHFVFIVSAFLYLILMQYTGFVISSIPFLIFLLWFFGHSKIGWCAFLSVTYVLAVYFIFLEVFRIRFPIGPLGF